MIARCVVVAAALLGAGSVHAQFVSQPVTTAYVGLPYVYDVSATGSGTVLITAPNGLPPWLTLEQTGNGTARLSGTPGPSDSGAGIVLRSEDSSCTVLPILCYQYQLFDITIVPNAPPSVVAPGIADQTGVEGTPFALDVSAAFHDPDGDPLTLTADGLPSGFTLSGGVISGTPTAAHAQGSPYTIRITAADGRGGSVADELVLTITALNRADLALASLTPSASPALVGDTVTFTVTVENRGPNASGDANVTIDLLGIAVSLGGHACSVDAAATRLVCPVAPIEAGQSTDVTFAATAPSPGDLFVTASLAPVAPVPIDPTPGNERRSAAVNFGAAISAEPAQQVGTAALAAAAADVDGDGYDDLVVATDDGEPAALHMNVTAPASLHPTLAESGDARRGLSTQPISLGDAVVNTGAATADFDGDGDLDAVVANGTAQATLFVNAGGGALTPGGTLGANGTMTRAIAAADVDGDGLADTVLANVGRNALYLNRGGSTFAAGTLRDSPRESVDVAVADLDGDARPDAVFANADGDATRHPNTGGGFAAPASIPTGATTAVAAGDLNGDGFADVVFARAVPGPSGVPSNPVFLNDGAGALTLAAELGASPTVDVLVADIDGDADLDIVAINATGAHQVFVNDGRGGFAQDPTLLVAPGATAGAVGRIGMRQGIDIVVVGANGAALFFNDGLGRLGLGDTARPVIQLIGEQEITVEVEQTYVDPGATATDDVDGTLTPSVDNPVDTKVIGTYVVTYTATDGAGNAAVPVTRTVHVAAREASGGGGGGVVDAWALAALLTLALFVRFRGGRRLSLRADGPSLREPRSTRSTLRPAAAG
ncbi:MAG TPA: FG-GAP-like repeat-containing protein [Gammaproteobacteria bacterium]